MQLRIRCAIARLMKIFSTKEKIIIWPENKKQNSLIWIYLGFLFIIHINNLLIHVYLNNVLVPKAFCVSFCMDQ